VRSTFLCEDAVAKRDVHTVAVLDKDFFHLGCVFKFVMCVGAALIFHSDCLDDQCRRVIAVADVLKVGSDGIGRGMVSNNLVFYLCKEGRPQCNMLWSTLLAFVNLWFVQAS
jgi:hypothetical protein